MTDFSMRKYGAWAPVIVLVLAACATTASPAPQSVPTTEVTGPVSSATPTPGTEGVPSAAATGRVPEEIRTTPASPPDTEQATPPATPSRESRLAVDLDSVPRVDLDIHGVPLQEVVFDTFDGGFLRLSEASERVMDSLRDVIVPIYQPGYSSAAELPWLDDDDLVIGYESGSNAYAYPIKILNFRELVNDVIDGVPVLVSYCPLCGSGVVYNRELEGTELLFGNTSALYLSDLVMFDHQTGSYWFQILGESIVGTMTGKRLKPLSAMTTSWGDWRRLHPASRLLVSDAGTAFDSRLSRDPFGESYQESLDQGRFPFSVTERTPDPRLRASELVVTAEPEGAAKAYPIGLIGDDAVNDTVGGTPVVLLSGEESGAVFSPVVSGRRLTFEPRDGRFVDGETNSTWNQAGRAVSGPLEGTRLEPVPSRRAFWFSIADAMPQVEVYLP